MESTLFLQMMAVIAAMHDRTNCGRHNCICLDSAAAWFMRCAGTKLGAGQQERCKIFSGNICATHRSNSFTGQGPGDS